MQIKTISTQRNNLTLIRMTIIKKSTKKKKILERVCRMGNPFHCWQECNLIQPLWKTVWRLL